MAGLLQAVLLLVLCSIAVSPTSAQVSFPQGKGTPTFKLYCAVIANQKYRDRDFHLSVRSCPVGDATCSGEWTPLVLRNPDGRTTRSMMHCDLQPSPVTFQLAFDSSDEDGYQERIEVLKPQVFDWRGLIPDAWCIRGAWYHFTDERSGASLAPGYVRGTQLGRCQWNEERDPKAPRADTGLPAELIGSWVPKGKTCPGSIDGYARTADTLWIQPHAVERANGECWLIGTFPLSKKLTVDALCGSAKGYKRDSFTFDLMSQNSLRLRQGRGRSVTYVRCEKDWHAPPGQTAAASKLTGTTHRFTLDIDAQMRSLDGKPVDGSHTRTIELEVGSNGELRDRLQIGGAAPKTFTARFGEVTPDTAGDRATWLIRDGRLVRARERRGYYELLSWPLNPDGKSVACYAGLEFIPTRKDGTLRTVSADGVDYEVIKAEIKSERCPATGGPLRIAHKEAPSAAKCIDPVVRKTPDGGQGSYELRFDNTCPYGIVVGVKGKRLRPSIISDVAGQGGGLMVGRSYPLKLDRDVDPDVLLKELKFAVITEDAYNRHCGSIKPEDWDNRLACFSKVYEPKTARRNELPEFDMGPGGDNNLSFDDGQKKKGGNTGVVANACLRRSFEEKPGTKDSDRSFELKLINDCADEIVALASGWTKLNMIAIVVKLPGNPLGAGADPSVWNSSTFKLEPGERPSEVFKKITFAAVKADAYETACGGVEKGSPRNRILCFDKVHGDKAKDTSPRTSDGKTQANPGEQVLVRHILLESESDATLAMKVLNGGADFAKTAQSLSVDKGTASKGGDLGWIARGKMTKAFEDAAFALKPGEISGPVKTEFGWDIIKVEDKRAQDTSKQSPAGGTNDIGTSLLWCSGPKSGPHQKTVDACTHLIEVWLVNRDGSLDRGSMALLYYFRGIALVGMHKYKDALADFDKAASLAPERGVYYYLRSAAHADLGHGSEAASDRKKACELDKKFCG
jgi:PPIC-type PPIASE domain